MQKWLMANNIFYCDFLVQLLLYTLHLLILSFLAHEFYKEKTSNRDFSKKRSQNFLIFAYVVGNYLNFWILAVST